MLSVYKATSHYKSQKIRSYLEKQRCFDACMVANGLIRIQSFRRMLETYQGTTFSY